MTLRWNKRLTDDGNEYSAGVFTIDRIIGGYYKWCLDNGNSGTCRNTFVTLREAKAYAERLEAEYQARQIGVL
jgi:hypothetical protein